jgi:hypothetical protein
MEAKNYKANVFLNSALVDGKGWEHVNQQSDVDVRVEYVKLSAVDKEDSKLAFIRKAAYDAVNTTYVKPANEQRKVWEDINGKKRTRVPGGRDLGERRGRTTWRIVMARVVSTQNFS